jgi:hypothetical protein
MTSYFAIKDEDDNINSSDMKTAEEIMHEHFKECFEIHKETISEKYILYFHKAMKEYAQQEREKAVSEFKERLLKIFKDEDGYLSCGVVESIIEKLK